MVLTCFSFVNHMKRNEVKHLKTSKNSIKHRTKIEKYGRSLIFIVQCNWYKMPVQNHLDVFSLHFKVSMFPESRTVASKSFQILFKILTREHN